MKGNKFLLVCLLCLSGLCATASTYASQNDKQPMPLLVVKTAKSMKLALADLKEAIADHNYVFIRQQNIDSRLTEAGAENGEVILVYFCNFRMANRALKTDPRVGVFLPCKITLIQKAGYIQLVAINPQAISGQLQQSDLKPICDQLTRDYSKILEEASI